MRVIWKIFFSLMKKREKVLARKKKEANRAILKKYKE
jgi:hypothetical protein